VFAFADTPRIDPGLRVHTFGHAVPGMWHVMGVMLSAGGSLRWYRDAVAATEVAEASRRSVDPYEVLTEQAATVSPGAEGLVFLPYLTGERTPYPDPYARGAFFGLSLRHGRPHMARAILEGVAYGLRDSLEVLREMGLSTSEVRASGGGARSALWLQIQADVTGSPLSTLNVEEGPAFGVALLAGVGAGIWGSVPAACDATLRVTGRTEPDPSRVALYDRYYQVYRSLYPALKDRFAEMAGLVEAGSNCP
jgi:xylulokinase